MVALTSEALADPVRLLAYAGLAVACFAAAQGAPVSYSRTLGAIGVIAIALGLTLTLGLGAASADLGRSIAGSEGWYSGRRSVQAAAIAAILIAGLISAGITWVIARRHVPALRFALIALLALFCYLAIRTISLHQVDAYLHRHPGEFGVRMGDIVEVLFVVTLVMAVLFAGVPHGNGSRPDAK